MKKIISILTIALLAASVFAVSYKNNTFQKLADEYTKKAEIALDAGQYDDAVEYSKKAEENAALSEEYIRHMLAKDNADRDMKAAKERIAAISDNTKKRCFALCIVCLRLQTKVENNPFSLHQNELKAILTQ